MTANPAEPGAGPAEPVANPDHPVTGGPVPDAVVATAEGPSAEGPSAEGTNGPAAAPVRSGAVRPPLPPPSAGNLALFERLLPPLPPTPFIPPAIPSHAASPSGATSPSGRAQSGPDDVDPAGPSPTPAVAAAAVPVPAGPDTGWVSRRLVAVLANATADERRRIAEATAQFGPVALARLATAADGPGESFAATVVRVLLDDGRPAPAAAVAVVVVRDHADRLGTLHPDTAAMVELLLEAHRRLDDDAVAGLLTRNAELAVAVAAALGPDHPAALATVRGQDRLRALWSRRRLWQTPPSGRPAT